MRYSIKCVNGNNEYPILQPHDKTLLLSGAKMSENLNKPGCLTFSIPRSNVNYNKIIKLESDVIVIDLHEGMEIFRGRVVADDTDIDGNKICTCLEYTVLSGGYTISTGGIHWFYTYIFYEIAWMPIMKRWGNGAVFGKYYSNGS